MSLFLCDSLYFYSLYNCSKFNTHLVKSNYVKKLSLLVLSVSRHSTLVLTSLTFHKTSLCCLVLIFTGSPIHPSRCSQLGLTDVRFEKDKPCAACQAGKQVETNHLGKNVMTTSRPLELLYMDLFRPVAYLSIRRSKYGLVIVDDFSHFTWVFFL
jgi:hypothetical protein